jgi:hypothetical protein
MDQDDIGAVWASVISEDKPMANAGNLRQFSLGEILRLIGDGLRRGRLVVERGGLRADLYCDNGYLLHVWRNGPTQPIAQRWLNSRFMTPPQVAQVGAAVNTDPLALSDADFVQFATEYGIISLDQVNGWAMSDAVDLLSVLLSWRDGDYRFEDGIAAPVSRLRRPLPIPSVLGLTMQRISPVQAAQTPIDVTLDDVLDFSDLDPTDPQPVQLTRDQWRVLTMVDGESTLAVIAQNLANSTSAPISDQQRYLLELRRNEEGVLRVAAELIADGIAVVCGRQVGNTGGRMLAQG